MHDCACVNQARFLLPPGGASQVVQCNESEFCIVALCLVSDGWISKINAPNHQARDLVYHQKTICLASR